MMDDLRAFGVPVLILSGGEPLVACGYFDIAARAKTLGFYVGCQQWHLDRRRDGGAAGGLGLDYLASAWMAWPPPTTVFGGWKAALPERRRAFAWRATPA